jgi:MFS family permease
MYLMTALFVASEISETRTTPLAEQRRMVKNRTLVLLAFSATAGVMVEFYDFFLYGYAAASAFPAVFFPNLPPTEALVFSYLAFGAGFPARLLGAFIFGHFGDRAGRKFAFLINISLVGLTTCLTGLLPGYATLGIAAPSFVVLRILQGIDLRRIWRRDGAPR